MNEKPSVTIIGTGAVGSALLHFFEKEGFTILSGWNSTSGYPSASSELGDLVFVTTPDDLISDVALHLSRVKTEWSSRTVIHCSGNLSSEIFSGLYVLGASTLSMHPIQTFRRGDDSTRFQNIFASLEGDEPAIEKIKPLVELMGASPLIVNNRQKRMIHLAAVMASNYLVSLMDLVDQMMKKEALGDGLQVLKPLIDQTFKNIFDKGTTESLSGPISRGDSGVVETHMVQPCLSEDYLEAYKVLGRQAVQIAERRGDLTPNEAEKIRSLLR